LAVKVKPPNTGENLLVEYCAIGAQEGPLDATQTLVPGLTSSIHISISIETRGLVSTGETGGGRG